MPDYRRILWDGRRWMLTAVLLFVVGAAAGAGRGPGRPPDEARRSCSPSPGCLREVGERLAAETSPVERTSIIFRNNGLALLRMMLLGLFPFPFFGFVPAAGTFVNGAMIGIVARAGDALLPPRRLSRGCCSWPPSRTGSSRSRRCGSGPPGG